MNNLIPRQWYYPRLWCVADNAVYREIENDTREIASSIIFPQLWPADIIQNVVVIRIKEEGS